MKTLTFSLFVLLLTLCACGGEEIEPLRFCDGSDNHICPVGTSCDLDSFSCMPNRFAPLPPAADDLLTWAAPQQCAPDGTICTAASAVPCCGRCVEGKCAGATCAGEGACAGTIGADGRCVYPAVGTICAATCSGSGDVVAENVSACDAQHRCVLSPAKICGAYRCDPNNGRCFTGCGSDPADRHKECINTPDKVNGVSVCDRSSAHTTARAGKGVCVDPRVHKVVVVRPRVAAKGKQIQDAITAAGDGGYVRIMAGTFNGPVYVTEKTKVALVADGKVELTSSVAKHPTLYVSGGGQLTVQGVVIRGSLNDGIGCLGSASAHSSITVLESEVANNGKAGVLTLNCTTELRRNRVHHNSLGGLLLGMGHHTVVNNLIARNGSHKAGSFGAFAANAVAMADFRFSHNTVVSNKASADAAAAGMCLNTLPLYNSIFFGNVDAKLTRKGVMRCVPVRSLVQHYPNAKYGSFSADPMFLDPANDLFTLGLTSPARDWADATTMRSSIDINGNPRQAGPAADLGAYEARAL